MKKLKLILIVLCSIFVLSSCKKDPITLPNIDDIQVITITQVKDKKDTTTDSITSSKDIKDCIELIKEKTSKYKNESNNDTPVGVSDYKKMEIFYGKDEITTLYLYKKDKSFVEIPYDGIWKIDDEVLNKLIESK